MKFMLDTNAYNELLDNDISVKELNGEFFTTHIPKDELNNTKKEERRKQLNAKFKEVHQKEIPTESGVYGISRYGKCKFVSADVPTESFVLDTSRLDYAKVGDSSVYQKLLNSLEKAKPKDEGNIKDALIGETAVKNEFVLVTKDVALQNAVKEYSPDAQVINFAKFIEVLKNESRI